MILVNGVNSSGVLLGTRMAPPAEDHRHQPTVHPIAAVDLPDAGIEQQNLVGADVHGVCRDVAGADRSPRISSTRAAIKVSNATLRRGRLGSGPKSK